MSTNLSRRRSICACMREALRSAITTSFCRSRPMDRVGAASESSICRSPCRSTNWAGRTLTWVDSEVSSSSVSCQTSSNRSTSFCLPFIVCACWLRVRARSAGGSPSTVWAEVNICPPRARLERRAARGAQAGDARLHVDGCPRRRVGRGEDGHHLVADSLHDAPATVDAGLADDRQATLDRRQSLGIAETLVELCAAAKVGKQNGKIFR